jgi:hypothetical protein
LKKILKVNISFPREKDIIESRYPPKDQLSSESNEETRTLGFVISEAVLNGVHELLDDLGERLGSNETGNTKQPGRFLIWPTIAEKLSALG